MVCLRRPAIGPVASGDSDPLAFLLNFRRHTHHPQPSMPPQRATSVSDPQLSIEGLPIELLEQIFLLTSARDILRLSMVRKFVKIIQIRTSAEHIGTVKGQPRIPWPCTQLSLDPIRDRPLWFRIAMKSTDKSSFGGLSRGPLGIL